MKESVEEKWKNVIFIFTYRESIISEWLILILHYYRKQTFGLLMI